jgi:UTP--glucose-1-phosphate uridylyltransferase
MIREVLPPHVRAVFVTQAEALGLGHAVLCAEPVVGNEPFAVLLPDDLIWNRGRGALGQMVDIAHARNASVIAVQDVPREQTGSYGIVDTAGDSSNPARIHGMVEKPAPEVAPSTRAVVGRYVLSGKVFELLRQTEPGKGGEIQLTDAIARLTESNTVLAYQFEGRRFDCGSRIGLVEATIRFALDHEDLADEARAYMRAALAEQDTA